MFLEYINYSADLTEAELTRTIDNLPQNVSTLVLPSFFIKSAKAKVNENTKISCLIDFPIGLSDNQTRLEACKFAIKNKTNYLDIVMPTNLLANRKYDKIREELKIIQNLCSESGVEARYILEYRAFEHQALKKACDILISFNITTFSLSTGYSIDNLSDYIIASKYLSETQSVKPNIILTANFWLEKHIQLILQNSFFAVRSSHIQNIIYLANFLQKPV